MVKYIPGAIGELVHLRFLDLGSGTIDLLPSSIRNLTRLLTLKLDRCRYIENGCLAGNVFEKMKQLRHLYLPKLFINFTHSNLKLSHLTKLQTLVNFPLKYLDTQDLVIRTMPGLRKWKVGQFDKGKCDEIFILALSSGDTFQKFNNLQSLSLNFRFSGDVKVDVTQVATCCPGLEKLKLVGPLASNIPEDFHILQNLSTLKLEESQLKQDPMPQLGKLPNLVVLCLHYGLRGTTVVCPQNSFPRLDSLVLSAEHYLEEWTVEEEALPRLRHLKISTCTKLKKLPDSLPSLTALQQLDIIRMPTEFTDKIKIGGEDYYKVQHIPFLSVKDT